MTALPMKLFVAVMALAVTLGVGLLGYDFTHVYDAPEWVIEAAAGLLLTCPVAMWIIAVWIWKRC